jgi:fatty-acyl-CoA synthase
VKVKVGATLTADDIHAFCEGKIAEFKVPKYIKVVDEFPMTVTGKIQKFRIRETFVKELGLREIARIETA